MSHPAAAAAKQRKNSSCPLPGAFFALMKDIVVKKNLVFIVCVLLAYAAVADEVDYCYDRSSYPVKVVVVPKGGQCPSGYYK